MSLGVDIILNRSSPPAILLRKAWREGTRIRHFTDGTLILYDVSARYVKGRCCPLAAFGHNRDGKAGQPEVMKTIVMTGSTADAREG